MISAKQWFSLAVMFAGVASGAVTASAQSQESLMPYAMMRSLQFVQDSVALGDHSAAEMQRFMLTTIDQRLKEASPSIFKDPRNVDAALIYAMSGGNPATLELLVARDVDGNFDSRVADALRKYLNGRGTLVAQTIAAMVPEYRGTKIGAYLALISGNVTLVQNPEAALGFYDIARLDAPGTIIEEAALRRSLAIAVEDGDAVRGLEYAQRYARRFLHSPYASQFADLIVSLSVRRFGEIDEAQIEETLSLMDAERQREVYLRLARLAAVGGKDGLARLAASKARMLSEGLPVGPEVQANLYESLSNIGTPDVVSAIDAISGIPDEHLSPRDRALREAAKVVAEEVVRPPVLESLTQDRENTKIDGAEKVSTSGGEQQEVSVETPGVWRSPTPVLGPESQEYRQVVTTGRSRLGEIDDLLKKESTSP